MSVYTADFPMYSVEDGEVFLYIAREPNNLFFDNFAEGTRQLHKTGHYTLTDRNNIDRVVHAADTLRICLSNLDLVDNPKPKIKTFEFDTEDYDVLNAEQRRLAERLFCSGDEFKEYMRILNNREYLLRSPIFSISVIVLNPDHVKHYCPANGALATASMLGNAARGSSFYAAYTTKGEDGGILGEARE
jgi:hypothetical protein